MGIQMARTKSTFQDDGADRICCILYTFGVSIASGFTGPRIYPHRKLLTLGTTAGLSLFAIYSWMGTVNDGNYISNGWTTSPLKIKEYGVI